MAESKASRKLIKRSGNTDYPIATKLVLTIHANFEIPEQHFALPLDAVALCAPARDQIQRGATVVVLHADHLGELI